MVTGTSVAQWLRCCATNRKVAGSIPDGVTGIFHWHNHSDRTMALGSTQPVTEMSTRRISWGKGGRCARLTTLPLPVPLSWSLGTLTSWNPLGHSRPVTGLLLDHGYISQCWGCIVNREFITFEVFRDDITTLACERTRLNNLINNSSELINYYVTIKYHGQVVTIPVCNRKVSSLISAWLPALPRPTVGFLTLLSHSTVFS